MKDLHEAFREYMAKNFVEDIEFGVYATTVDREIIYWNRAAEKITGYSKAEVVGKGCWENILNHIDKNGKLLCGKELCPLHKSMATGSSTRLPFTVLTKHRDGHRVPTQVMCTPIRDRDGKVLGGVEMFRDVTAEYRELETARKIQGVLAASIPPLPAWFTAAARYYPAEMLGGDFLTVIPRNENQVVAIVGDVSGHGVSSALVTALFRSIVEAAVRKPVSTRELAERIERRYNVLDVKGKHITAAICLFDRATRTLTYTNAAHCQPLLWRAAEGTVEVLEQPANAFGWGFGEPFSEQRYALAPGDRLFLCTDGVYELAGAGGEQWGIERTAQFLREQAARPADRLLDELHRRLFAFQGSADAQDDIAYMLVGFAD